MIPHPHRSLFAGDAGAGRAAPGRPRAEPPRLDHAVARRSGGARRAAPPAAAGCRCACSSSSPCCRRSRSASCASPPARGWSSEAPWCAFTCGPPATRSRAASPSSPGSFPCPAPASACVCRRAAVSSTGWPPPIRRRSSPRWRPSAPASAGSSRRAPGTPRASSVTSV
jgi:hypothetical protein